MGRYFLGLEEARRAYGKEFDAQEREELSEIPFEKSTLERYRCTHLLVAGCRMSLHDLRVMNPELLLFGPCLKKQEAFLHQERTGVRWYLIGKFALKQSCNRAYHEALPLLPAEEQVPMACEVVYAHLLYYRWFGKWQLRTALRCSSAVEQQGNHVMVRPWNEDMISVDYLPGRMSWAGLAHAALPDGEWLTV